ncbi:fused response regulator/phosphatase [Reinekea marina]|uniref:SpoIIE family protein phosphatase n=1 Tax=Reinekea marina TaxID=1310421 RepID=A0ABV7WMW5_9GAMM|nr:fused response regulator/phosphatase [Reinekea marina]MDN3649366.1 fused response regulator/phosphatase [Reinekea marina]
MSNALNILIADDNETDRLILQKIVEKEGHQVVLAQNGQEAIDRFVEHKPDLILLDVMMPVLDGLEAARRIKSLLVDDLVPIIFLTSLQDASSLAECLEAGGDDFLSKPYNRIILKAKIMAFGRMRVMHEKLQVHNRQMLIEQQVAKTIFDNVAHSGCLNLDNIRYSLSPLSVFNGDTVLAERKPDGGIHLFLGDFTGHGLPAAIGAMPLAEIFYGMTAKGFSVDDILREINSRLQSILPVGVFCCGCFVELDLFEKKARIWLGGLPDIVMYRNKSQSFETLPSNNLPLGVLSSSKFAPVIVEVSMDNDDELFVWSDGIIESRNSDNEMFGEERLLEIFKRSKDQSTLFDTILNQVDQFVSTASVEDDLTLATIKMIDMDSIGLPDFESTRGSLVGPQEWDFDYYLRGQSLKSFNPLPMILNILTEVEGLRSLSGQLYTLMAELYSNALEHGVLGLDSKVKASSDGFQKYYLERESKLEALTEGFVRISIKHIPVEGGGELVLQIEDSGPGFNHQAFMQKDTPLEGYTGRGIPLIRGICREFNYNGSGNKVTATLTWNQKG